MFLRFYGADITPSMEHMAQLVVLINIFLAIFNLVPIPPLDGSKVLLSVLPHRYRYIGNYLERYALVLIILFAFFLWKYILPLVYLIYLLFVGF